MCDLRGYSALLVVLATLLLSIQAFAQSDTGLNARVFGLGQPDSVQSLPPGKLKSRLKSLPPQASSKALQWLQDFSFPATDLDLIEVDDEGGVFYADTLLPDPDHVAASASSGPTLAEAAPTTTLDDAFLLHSKPGSSNVVFIDFDGAVISGTAWNGTHSRLDAVPYNLAASVDGEGDSNTFSEVERTRIVDIWHRVAEDLAPYDIDVTTEEPASFNSNTGTILVTNSVDANGKLINCDGCGGVAYVNVFGLSNYHTYYSPALVFFNKLGGGGETYIAEASSHEFGHNLGLSHDGTTTGSTYYGGHGTGLVSWAPIMGNSYYNNVTQWSIGEYANANQFQDDLAIIDGKLGYRADDIGNTPAAAADLLVSGDGTVVSSNPELDPHNLLTDNKGIINSADDVDVFTFVTGAGAINLNINPGWDAFYRSSSRRGSNLDIEAELQDQTGATLVLDDPVTDTAASVSAMVTAGTYYLLISGVGNAVTPYSDYDSLGQYFINGTVPPAQPDNTAPTPDPMTWSSLPTAISHNAISMTATTATDDISSVEYNFLCTVGGAGCVNSGWQSAAAYTATGLASSSTYAFRVRARDQAGNETAGSNTASATTAAPPPPPLSPTSLIATGVSETGIALEWIDEASTEMGYRLERSASGGNNFATIVILGADVVTYTDNGLSSDTTYDYRVAAFNDSGDSGFATASGKTDAPPPYTNYVAVSDVAVAGTVSGTVVNTRVDDDSSQSITERESGGKPANRHTYLEHRWNFNVSNGVTVTVFANAWSGGSSDGDEFRFEYSLDNGNSFSALFTVSSTDSTNLQSGAVTGSPSGSIMIRVVDTDQTSGNRDKNTILVDHLYIQVGNPTNEVPNGDPFGMNATAVSSSQIDISWQNGSDNESGFKLERSADGAGNWSVIADLPAASTSYSDNGLQPMTSYFYRVSAYTQPDKISAYDYADAITPDAPPPPALSLNASGIKVKGEHTVSLSWSGSESVDVYRDGTKQATVNGNAYDDNIGSKGGATYLHKVCNAGTDTCSNTTETVF